MGSVKGGRGSKPLGPWQALPGPEKRICVSLPSPRHPRPSVLVRRDRILIWGSSGLNRRGASPLCLEFGQERSKKRTGEDASFLLTLLPQLAITAIGG